MKMRVVTVDQNGTELDEPKWVDTPAPKRFAKDGLAKIPSYVVRLLRASGQSASLVIATPDKQFAGSLMKHKGILLFNIIADLRKEPERENAIRQFFAARSLPPFQDYLANGEVPATIRCLSFQLPNDANFITELTKGFLQQVYGLGDHSGLDFTYKGNMSFRASDLEYSIKLCNRINACLFFAILVASHYLPTVTGLLAGLGILHFLVSTYSQKQRAKIEASLSTTPRFPKT